MSLWLVGKINRVTAEGVIWSFQGIFTEEKKATDACADESYFVAPVVPDAPVDGEVSEMQYPRRTCR